MRQRLLRALRPHLLAPVCREVEEPEVGGGLGSKRDIVRGVERGLVRHEY